MPLGTSQEKSELLGLVALTYNAIFFLLTVELTFPIFDDSKLLITAVCLALTEY